MRNESRNVFIREANTKGAGESSSFKGNEKSKILKKPASGNPSIKNGDVLSRLEKDGKIPSKDKFRLLPCNVTKFVIHENIVEHLNLFLQTFIMSGACPYHDRCE